MLQDCEQDSYAVRAVNVVTSAFDSSSGDINKVWRAFYDEKSKFIDRHLQQIHPSYIDGLQRLKLPYDRFPTLDELQSALKIAGWSVCLVPGFIPGREYARLLLERIFPVASTVRPFAQVRHASVPDSIHDIWGHLPMLFDPEYRELLLSIARAIHRTNVGQREISIYAARNRLGSLEADGATPEAVQAARSELDRLEAEESQMPEAFTKLQRFFLWSIEFGLVGNMEHPKLFGAALLSSFDDAQEVMERHVPVLRFTNRVMDTEINFTKAQEQLFVVDRVSDYFPLLGECRTLAETKVGTE